MAKRTHRKSSLLSSSSSICLALMAAAVISGLLTWSSMVAVCHFYSAYCPLVVPPCVQAEHPLDDAHFRERVEGDKSRRHMNQQDERDPQDCLVKLAQCRRNGTPPAAAGSMAGVPTADGLDQQAASAGTVLDAMERVLSGQPPFNPASLADEAPLRYARHRLPFAGSFGLGWFEQSKCLSMSSRWHFSLGGRINQLEWHEQNNDFTRIGQPQPAGTLGHLSVGHGQIYFPTSDHYRQSAAARNLSAAGQPLPPTLQWTLDGGPLWTAELIQFMLSEVARGADISCADYGDSAGDVLQALQRIDVRDKSVMVGGSISPWVEVLALHAGAASVTTTDWSKPHCVERVHEVAGRPDRAEVGSHGCHARMSTQSMLDVLRADRSFDVIVSYSSIEHDGLGRYGDIVDPFGDFHAMREFWSLLKPGGMLLLAVPTWRKDFTAHLLARLYSEIRLPALLNADFFSFEGSVNKGEFSPNAPLGPDGLWDFQPILLLRKTAPGEPRCQLDCTDATTKHDNWCRPSCTT